MQIAEDFNKLLFLLKKEIENREKVLGKTKALAYCHSALIAL
jgi:hypothetical protein